MKKKIKQKKNIKHGGDLNTWWSGLSNGEKVGWIILGIIVFSQLSALINYILRNFLTF